VFRLNRADRAQTIFATPHAFHKLRVIALSDRDPYAALSTASLASLLLELWVAANECALRFPAHDC
jgi:hypothetical protein